MHNYIVDYEIIVIDNSFFRIDHPYVHQGRYILVHLIFVNFLSKALTDK